MKKQTIPAIIHIGGPKCGSSALQMFLTRQPRLKVRSTSEVISYAAIRPNGSVLSGARLMAQGNKAPQQYINSIGANALAILAERNSRRLHKRLRRASEDCGRIVLSCEGWAGTARIFHQHALLDRLQIDATALLYIRPQVDLLNSAWWQWGAWSRKSFVDWSKEYLAQAGNWYEMAEGWRRDIGLSGIIIRQLPRDVTTDFCQVFDLKASGEALPVINSGLPAEILRVFQRHRNLRPSPHNSAIDFVLRRYFSDLEGRPPWVIPRATIKAIIDESREANQALMNQLAPDQATLMERDPRWWDADCYLDKPVESADMQLADPAAMDQLAARALAQIYQLDQELSQLRNGWNNPRRWARDFYRRLFV